MLSERLGFCDRLETNLYHFAVKQAVGKRLGRS
jgi:hypothetical protein